ncbi:MAG TPA: DNA-directed RNA polymerase subunit beta', partial [Planctomycetota bacterium]|nr:DNA-directed RNA polymerase subunit beta' [Planctomycetota bacterium]
GHITLAAPVVHIWFFKAMPSRLGRLLGKKTSSLEKVIYFQEYIVTDHGDTPMKDRELLTEEEYRKAREQYGDGFEAGMGAEAVKKILGKINLEKLYEELQQELRDTSSKQKIKNIIKRLKIVKALRDSENKPEWMVLDVIPVIPPELRPLVLLESGNFATSDLNDLYRRVINRNNRLKKLLDLGAPEVIIRNEKRMLQQAVDSLFDNNRCRRPALGSNNRPLKSLTDMIKGKQGRFRQNLLGKRVDYSARSVIVVGPELKLHQCGLPKKIALELFQPFIIRRLKELGHADTIKSAKKMLERKDREVWDILEDVTQNHPVLLNRAPTLHRMGIQAFEPVLIEGNAIKIHPLVCAGFNADFDGDQMAVHLPLSLEAQVEASTLMLSVNNIFSPASGSPVIAASQDIVMGCYYLTALVMDEKGEMLTREEAKEKKKPFRAYESAMEALQAHAEGKIGLHARIYVRMPAGRAIKNSGDKPGEPLVKPTIVETTVGRIVFNDALPQGMPYYNYVLSKAGINATIADCHKILGTEKTLVFLDDLKELGFKYSTLAGLSFATADLKIPAAKAT